MNLRKIVDYHRKELYYDALEHNNKQKKALKFHIRINKLWKTNPLLFLLQSLGWMIRDLPTFISCWWYRREDIEILIENYWLTKHRIKVQEKLEERLDKYEKN